MPKVITVDQELWSAATRVLDLYGDDAPAHIAERVGALALEGDMDGVDAWRLIALRLDQMMRPNSVQ